jgi:hypothetical protein
MPLRKGVPLCNAPSRRLSKMPLRQEPPADDDYEFGESLSSQTADCEMAVAEDASPVGVELQRQNSSSTHRSTTSTPMQGSNSVEGAEIGGGGDGSPSGGGKRAGQQKPTEPSKGTIILWMVLFSLSATSMMIVNKLSMKEAHLPSFIGTVQFAVTALTVFTLSTVGQCPKEDTVLLWSRVCPYQLYSFIFVATIYTNLQALLHSSIATIIVFRAAVPLVVCVLDWACLGRQLPSMRSVLALLFVAGSAMVYVASDREFQVRGVSAFTVRVWLTNASLTAGSQSHCMTPGPHATGSHVPHLWQWVGLYAAGLCVELTYAKHIVGPQLGFKSIWGPVYHSNLLSIGTMAGLMLLTSEEAKVVTTVWSWRLCAYIGLSCLVSVAISYSGWKCRSLISASCYTVLGVGNKMLTVLANSLLWDDGLSWTGAICLAVCLIAACCYKQAPLRGEAPPPSLTSELITAYEQTRRAAKRYLEVGEGEFGSTGNVVDAPHQPAFVSGRACSDRL